MGPYFMLWLFWIGVPILSIIFGLLAGFGLDELITRHQRWLRRMNPAGPYILGGVVLFAVCLIGYNTAVNGFGEPIAIVAPDNSIVALAGQNRDVVWRWDKRLRGNRVIDLSPATYSLISMELQPITSNPKVRPLKYWVSIGAPGTPEARLKYLSEFGSLRPNDNAYNQSVVQFVKYRLYEFDEHHSKELAMLYNPLDDKQQYQLLVLLRNSIGSDLEKVGLRIDGAGFDFISISDLITKKGRD
jgi:hypothetical protein